jgi:hypothetical protein
MEYPSETYDRGFKTLFDDSIRLLIASKKNFYDYDSHFSFARGSIVCSMLLPEVSANKCIESLQLDKGFFNEIDKLSPIAKFDYFLRVFFKGKTIDRGLKPVQQLQELKKLRDSFVHPKKSLVKWVKNQDDDSYLGSSPNTEMLKMSVNPQMWGSDDAITAMRGVHDFLHYFFIEKCKFTKKTITNLLFSHDVMLSHEESIVPYYDDSFHINLRKWV